MKRVDLAKIKKIRKKKGKSLEYMAGLLGYESPNGYYYLETGKGKFSAEALAVVADDFDVPINELFYADKIAKSVIRSKQPTA